MIQMLKVLRSYYYFIKKLYIPLNQIVDVIKRYACKTIESLYLGVDFQFVVL